MRSKNQQPITWSKKAFFSSTSTPGSAHCSNKWLCPISINILASSICHVTASTNNNTNANHKQNQQEQNKTQQLKTFYSRTCSEERKGRFFRRLVAELAKPPSMPSLERLWVVDSSADAIDKEEANDEALGWKEFVDSNYNLYEHSWFLAYVFKGDILSFSWGGLLLDVYLRAE